MLFSVLSHKGKPLHPGSWSFGGDTPDLFDDHIEKSVPHYASGHDLVCDLADFFLRVQGSKTYDLGCSTGTLLKKISESRNWLSAEFIGIDVEQGMIDVAQQRRIENATFLCADISEVEIEKADLVLMYYTLQFVPTRIRQSVVNKIYEGLTWGGGFVLFEKVRGPDARFQDMFTSLYTDFKLRQGFTESEIVQKARSLKGVLEPFSSEGNLGLLHRAGFRDVVPVFKYLSFEGVLAIK